MLTHAQNDGARRIGRIDIVRQPIFDTTKPAERNFISSLANAFHWQTKESIIRNELLYHEGETLNPDLIEESDRNLRALGFIGDIRTQIDTFTDSTARVTVSTHDKWTLALSPSYQQGGGLQTYSLTAKDDNFLGNAQSMSLGYDYRSDQPNPHGVEAIFSERRLFGSRWGMKSQYKNSNLLRVASIYFDRPYYSDETPWAAGLYADHSDIRIPFFQNSIQVRENLISEESGNAFCSYSFGDKVKVRPSLAVVRIRSSGPGLRTFDNVTLLSLSLNVMRRTYSQKTFLDSHGRIEDVPSGFLAAATCGKNFHPPGTGDPGYFVDCIWQHVPIANEWYYLGYSVGAASYLGGEKPRETTIQWMLQQYAKPDNHQVALVRIQEISGSDWSMDRQLYLGTQTGLRGYGEYQFSGQHLLLWNLEYRIFSDADFWIFRPGGAIFFDGGTTWNQGEDLQSQRFHNAVGFGFRVENTKQQGTGTIRLDFAYNLDEHKFAEVIISSSVLFSAFQQIGFISPTGAGGF